MVTYLVKIFYLFDYVIVVDSYHLHCILFSNTNVNYVSSLKKSTILSVAPLQHLMLSREPKREAGSCREATEDLCCEWQDRCRGVGLWGV